MVGDCRSTDHDCIVELTRDDRVHLCDASDDQRRWRLVIRRRSHPLARRASASRTTSAWRLCNRWHVVRHEPGLVTSTCASLLADDSSLCRSAMRGDLLSVSTSGLDAQTIDMPDIETIRIPLPPLDEQRQIVEHRRASDRRRSTLQSQPIDSADRPAAGAPPGADHRGGDRRARHPGSGSVTGRTRSCSRRRSATGWSSTAATTRSRTTRRRAPPDFDRSSGLDTGELFAFIGATQADAWERADQALRRRPGRARSEVRRAARQRDRRARHGRRAAARRRRPGRRRSGSRTSSQRTG